MFAFAFINVLLLNASACLDFFNQIKLNKSQRCKHTEHSAGALCFLLRHLSNYQSSPLYVASSSKGSHMTGLSSSFAFFDVQKRRVGWWRRRWVGGRGGGGGCGGSVAAGETKPDTGYLEAEMGGACMPNGDTDQRLISLGAHFNLATQNTHTHLRAHAHTHSKPKTSYNGSHVDINNLVVKSGK